MYQDVINFVGEVPSNLEWIYITVTIIYAVSTAILVLMPFVVIFSCFKRRKRR